MATYRWIEPRPVTIPEPLRAFVGGHPLVAETLVRRGITTVEEVRGFLDPDAYEPAPPSALPNLDRAVARIEAAIQGQERICVWGDFDVDGQTATTLLVAALRDLGGQVAYHIPVRAEESHGIGIPHLTPLIDEGMDLLLTCDTGVAAHEAVAYANDRGVDVVITDHHELAPMLPPAHAVVNPHLLPPEHPLAPLPGVGVAYKLAEAIYERAGRAAEVTRHLDLVALGIVADVAEQRADVRYLLQRGLEALRDTSRLGLRELMKVAGLQSERLNTEHIGFALGPRLNALGRLGDANVIVGFFTTEDKSQARILASRLEALNRERQRLCDAVLAGAEAKLEREPQLLDYGALVLAHPEWHPGVIGIVASRLSERYHRPTILLAAPEGEAARGSARSVEGCNIVEAIAEQADLLQGFGGHAMAAGLAIAPDQIPAFRQRLSRAVIAQRGKVPPPPAIHIDGYLPLSDLSLDLVDDLERLAPFGAGNPLLTLATRDLVVRSHSTLGRDGAHRQLVVEDEAGTRQRVLWWRSADFEVPEGRFDLAYTVRANTYQGLRRLQVTWVGARKEAPAVVEAPAPSLEVIDYRREPHPQTLLRPWLDREGVVIWAEGNERLKDEGGRMKDGGLGQEPGPSSGTEAMVRGRHELEPASTLVIWTIPPGPEVLEATLERVEPKRVVLFAVDPGLAGRRPFLERLMGLVKHALKAYEGRMEMADLGAALAHRKATVRTGIDWLAAKGLLTMTRDSLDSVEIEQGGEPSPAESARLLAQLQELLAETAAYRRHFIRTDAEKLVRFPSKR